MTRDQQIDCAIRVALTGILLDFGDLFDEVLDQIPDVTATEVDTAARPYEVGIPGAYVYRTA